jgi:glucose-1-phosphate cytidylyltransferase
MIPMKVVILCGGKGTRFQPLTKTIPKPMAKIGDMPILEHIMKIYAYYGFDDFILLIGYKGGIILDYFSENHPDWNIEFKFTGIDTQTGERVFKAKELLDDTFFLTYGDGLADINLKKELEFHKSHDGIGTITITPLPSQFGVISVGEDNKITNFIEKPILKEHWINGGFFIFDSEIFDYKVGKDLEKDVLPALSKKGFLYAYKHTGFWRCMDQYKDQVQLKELWEKGIAEWAIWESKR